MILVLAADHVYQMDYRRMAAFHEQRGADVTIGVIPVPREEAHRFGIVATNAEGRIVDFVEKPKFPKSNLASMGIYIFNKEILSERLREDAADPYSLHDFGHSIIPNMLGRGEVFAYEFDGYWKDIGTVEAYYEANMELISDPPPLSLGHGWPVLTEYADLLPREESRIGNLTNNIISPGCIVRGRVENSILSPGVEIAEHAVVRNSIIMANTIIGRYSVVDRCILDEKVTVGEFCRIGSEGMSFSLVVDPVAGNQDITVVGKSTVIPSHTAIGPNSNPLPNLDIPCRVYRSNYSSTMAASCNLSQQVVG